MPRKKYKPEEIVTKLRQVIPGVAGEQCCGRDPPARCQRGDLLQVALGVRRHEVGAGQVSEGPGVSDLFAVHLVSPELNNATASHSCTISLFVRADQP